MKQILLFVLLVPSNIGCLSERPSGLNGHIDRADLAHLPKFYEKQSAVPEYEPSSAVIISPLLIGVVDAENFLNEISQSGITTVLVPDPTNDPPAQKNLLYLRSLLKKNYAESEFTKKLSIKTMPFNSPANTSKWVRDYGPIITKSKVKPNQLVVADFNYHSDRPADDIFNTEFAKHNHLNRFQIPIYFEGGNFIALTKNDELHCLMTQVIVSNNSDKSIPSDLIYNEFDISLYFEKYLGCKKTHIIPRMPFEPTGHIDMWAKAFPNGVMVVADLSAGRASLSNDPFKASMIQTYLNDRAKQFENLGYTVKRIPLPTPHFKIRGKTPETLIRSYVNSLILNHHIYVPRYRTPPCNSKMSIILYPDYELTESYEKKVNEVYQGLGYTVHWINSDKLIALGGAIHCATMQLPAMTFTGPDL